MYDKYLIKNGDSLNSIAKKFNTSIDRILDINDIYDIEQLRAGMEIVIPKEQEDYITYYTVNQGDTTFTGNNE